MSYHRLYRTAQLESSWKIVRANGAAPGGDGVGLSAFEAGLGEHLLALSRALKTESYRPGPLRNAQIPRADGKLRLLRIPGLTDRVVQTACHRVLSPVLDGLMRPESFGYRPKRGVIGALVHLRKSAVGMTWALDADIRRFFDEVHHARLTDDLAFWVPDAQTLRLIGHWLAGFGRGQSLAQGAPISPLLANVALHPLDMAFAREGIPFVRYADDFVALAPTRRAAQAAQSLAAEVLARRGLALHPDKTRLVPLSQGIDFLGQHVTF